MPLNTFKIPSASRGGLQNSSRDYFLGFSISFTSASTINSPGIVGVFNYVILGVGFLLLLLLLLYSFFFFF
jgi:hypothetical protein